METERGRNQNHRDDIQRLVDESPSEGTKSQLDAIGESRDDIGDPNPFAG